MGAQHGRQWRAGLDNKADRTGSAEQCDTITWPPFVGSAYALIVGVRQFCLYTSKPVHIYFYNVNEMLGLMPV